MQLSFSPSEIVADQVRPGARILFFSVAREARGYHSEVVRRESVVADSDTDGRVVLALGQAVPLKSIWCAVDLATAEHAIEAPTRFRLEKLPFPATALRLIEGQVRALELDRALVHVLLVRPGVGAWTDIVSDGGPRDTDGAPGGWRLSFAALPRNADGNLQAPAHLMPGDLIVAIDGNELEVLSDRVAAGAEP
jgi:hypothetical protein